jgi:hypothetical protein
MSLLLLEGQDIVLYAAQLRAAQVVVVDTDGRPVSGARVWGNAEHLNSDSTSVLTDERGECRVMAVGRPHVRFSARGPDELSYGYSERLTVDDALSGSVRIELSRRLLLRKFEFRPAPGSEKLAGMVAQVTSQFSETFPIGTRSVTLGGPAVSIPLHWIREQKLNYVGPLWIELPNGTGYSMSVSPRSLSREPPDSTLIVYVADEGAVSLDITVVDSLGARVPYFALRLNRRPHHGTPRHWVGGDGRGISGRTDASGVLTVQCAPGEYLGPGGPVTISDGMRQLSIDLPGSLCWGRASTPVGFVTIQDIASDSLLAGRGGKQAAVRVGPAGFWACVVPVSAGTPVEVRLVEPATKDVLAEARGVTGLARIDLNLPPPLATSARTHVRVTHDGQVVDCQLAFRTLDGHVPNVQRYFGPGATRFDVSTLPRGQYLLEIYQSREVGRTVLVAEKGPFDIGYKDQVFEIELR